MKYVFWESMQKIVRRNSFKNVLKISHSLKKRFFMLARSVLKRFLIFYHCCNSLVAQRLLLTETQHLPESLAAISVSKH